jgi:PAS domain S-box-containing protein
MAGLPTDKIISCFYDSSSDCVKVLDTNGTLLSFNPNGLKVMEIDNEKTVIGQDWLSFWQGNLHEKAAGALKIANSGSVGSFEGYCPTFKGTMKYWEVTIAPLHNDYGDIQWLLVTSRDMTRYKDMEKRVVELEIQVSDLKSQVQPA